MEDPGPKARAADSRAALRRAAAGLLCLATGMAVGGLGGSDGLLPVLCVTAGYFGLVALCRRALILWAIDALAFEGRLRGRRRCAQTPREARPLSSFDGRRRALHLAGLVLFASLSASAARSQQTVFNVPTADVLDRGKLYLETDWLWRPIEPRFSTGAIRAVCGVGSDTEAGVNIGGFAPGGASTVVGVPNVKWQPLRSDSLSLTTGALALFNLGGSRQRAAGIIGYAHAAARLAAGTRLTAGGWMASPHYVGSDAAKGGLFALEPPVTSSVMLAADWYTGGSDLGYATPGLIITEGRWILYLSYTFKNGDSRGNGLLLELGFTL